MEGASFKPEESKVGKGGSDSTVKVSGLTCEITKGKVEGEEGPDGMGKGQLQRGKGGSWWVPGAEGSWKVYGLPKHNLIWFGFEGKGEEEPECKGKGKDGNGKGPKML